MTYLSIQGLRGVAAMLVVMHHYNQVFGTLSEHGRAERPWLLTLGHLDILGGIGVSLFFVISGFVIANQALKDPPDSLQVYLAKRVSRIVPFYWVVTLAFVWAAGQPFDAQTVKSLLFIAHSPDSNPVVAPGWTLEFEIRFYLMFGALVMSGFVSRGIGMLLLAGILACTVIAGQATGSAAFYTIGDPVILEFVAGMAVAHLVRLPQMLRFGWLCVILGFGFAYLSMAHAGSWTTMRTLWGLTSFSLVLGLVSLESVGRALMRQRPFQVLGDASYSIYLVHMPLLLAVLAPPIWRYDLARMLEPHIGLMVLMTIAALVGIACYYLIEKPVWQGSRRILLSAIARRSRLRVAVSTLADPSRS